MKSSLRQKTEKRIKLSAVAVLAIFVPASWAGDVTLTFKTADTEYRVSFDPSRISERQMRELIVLSPLVTQYAGIPGARDFWMGGSTMGTVVDKVLFAIPLEYCSKDDPAYTNCQKNDISSPDFLRNAKVNVEKSRRGRMWLQHLDHPRELEPVVDYLLPGLAVSVWSGETRLRYFLTWDADVLKQGHESLEPAQLCREVFTKLDAAQSKEEKYRLVESDWASCVNKAAKRGGNTYPVSAWAAFLQIYGIKEHYEEKGPD